MTTSSPLNSYIQNSQLYINPTFSSDTVPHILDGGHFTLQDCTASLLANATDNGNSTSNGNGITTTASGSPPRDSATTSSGGAGTSATGTANGGTGGNANNTNGNGSGQANNNNGGGADQGNTKRQNEPAAAAGGSGGLCTVSSLATSGTVINPVMSARLSTKGKKSIRFGKVEVRAKLPRG